MSNERFEVEHLLTPAEVATLFNVSTKTVTSWANSGKLPCVRTLGGHRRFPSTKVYALLILHPPADTTQAESDRR